MDVRFLFSRDGNTVAGVAKKIGANYATVYHWSAGRHPSGPFLDRLMAAGLVRPSDLVLHAEREQATASRPAEDTAPVAAAAASDGARELDERS